MQGSLSNSQLECAGSAGCVPVDAWIFNPAVRCVRWHSAGGEALPSGDASLGFLCGVEGIM